ncbi:MAG: XRE family transcriptional regulator [Bifidobacterium longum]
MAIPEGLNGTNGKAWVRATRARIGLAQGDVAELVHVTPDMVKKWESEKYPDAAPSLRVVELLDGLLEEHREHVADLVSKHKGEKRVTLTYLRILEFPDDVGKVDRILHSPSRHDAEVREAAAILEVFGSEVIYAYPSGK